MEFRMRCLVVGLGSMGKRRIRNLRALGMADISGFDPRADRREEAVQKYGVTIYDEFRAAVAGFRPDVVVISTPPQHHMAYAWSSFEQGIPCFVEASVVDADRMLALHQAASSSPVLVAPSCTMRYFPGPRKVKELIRAGTIGRPLSFNYYFGQYLPDWHPWERIEDFYVSNRDTGACREIVPFELTWLNDLFGDPEPLACVRAKLSDMNANIDDVYHCIVGYPGGVLGNLTVEVLARPHAVQDMRVAGSEGFLVFNAHEHFVRYATIAGREWTHVDLNGGTIEAGYIYAEEPYIAEMRDFLNAVRQRDKSLFPNTLLDDYNVLQTLYRLEALTAGS
jgi:predicted dehydrogenase